MIGYSGWCSGSFDPEPEHGQWLGPQDTAPVQPDGSLGEVAPGPGPTPAAERALAEFEQLLHQWDAKTTVAQMLEELDLQLGRLRPGGSWTKPEEEAVKLLRLLAYRMRRKLA